MNIKITISLFYIYTDPVEINESLENKKLLLLSNGEIRTSSQDNDEAERRLRRSAMKMREYYEREKRTKKKRIETLVIVDKKFIEKHKNDERSITIYILTIMNMVLHVILL